MSKIYIVKSTEGLYEDYRSWNEKAFIKKEDAEKYAKLLDEARRYKPPFITDEFISALQECEYELPTWEYFPGGPLTPENEKEWTQWNNNQKEKQMKLLIDLMSKKGYSLTKELYSQYDQWASDSYNEWHDCKIEEIELI